MDDVGDASSAHVAASLSCLLRETALLRLLGLTFGHEDQGAPSLKLVLPLLFPRLPDMRALHGLDSVDVKGIAGLALHKLEQIPAWELVPIELALSSAVLGTRRTRAELDQVVKAFVFAADVPFRVEEGLAAIGQADSVGRLRRSLRAYEQAILVG